FLQPIWGIFRSILQNQLVGGVVRALHVATGMVTGTEEAFGRVGTRRGQQRPAVRGELRLAPGGRLGRGIEAMTLIDRGGDAPRRMYSWRRTLLFFVLAALIG